MLKKNLSGRGRRRGVLPDQPPTDLKVPLPKYSLVHCGKKNVFNFKNAWWKLLYIIYINTAHGKQTRIQFVRKKQV